MGDVLRQEEWQSYLFEVWEKREGRTAMVRSIETNISSHFKNSVMTKMIVKVKIMFGSKKERKKKKLSGFSFPFSKYTWLFYFYLEYTFFL